MRLESVLVIMMMIMAIHMLRETMMALSTQIWL